MKIFLLKTSIQNTIIFIIPFILQIIIISHIFWSLCSRNLNFHSLCPTSHRLLRSNASLPFFLGVTNILKFIVWLKMPKMPIEELMYSYYFERVLIKVLVTIFQQLILYMIHFTLHSHGIRAEMRISLFVIFIVDFTSHVKDLL